ncbi:hypothetical protein RFI_36862, partial [Reticulomyxa filosa]
MYIIVMAVVTTVWFKIPRNEEYADVFAIRQELKNILILILFSFIVAFFLYVISSVYTSAWALLICLDIIPCIGIFLFRYVRSPKHFKHNNKKKKKRIVLSLIQTAYVLRRCEMMTKSEVKPMKFSDPENRNQPKLKFRECMANEESLDLFITHLQREFSMENLVASIELLDLLLFYYYYYYCVQYIIHKYIYLYTDLCALYQMAELLLPLVSSQRREQFQQYHKLDFYKFAPRSYIVTLGADVEMKMLLLHEKYVSSRAHFEVNVPSYIKDEWKSYCEAIKADHGARSLDDVFKSLYARPEGITLEADAP